ncbi:MAG: hypothetical protein ACLQVI_29120 [Polyangiaceae bacterium]
MATIAIPDGRVLFIGGGLYDESGDQVEVDAYDPRTDKVERFASLNRPRLGAGAAALPDGRVVVVGGGSERVAMTSVEVYQPSTGAFGLVPNVLHDPVRYPFVVPLPRSRALIGGGRIGAPSFEASHQSFVFDLGSSIASKTPGIPWPLGTIGNFHYHGSDNLFVVHGFGPGFANGSIKSGPGLTRTCDCTFDISQRDWTGCKAVGQQDLRVLAYPSATSEASALGWDISGSVSSLRAGVWSRLRTFSDKTHWKTLFDGMALSASSLVASDEQTQDIVVCNF